MKNVKRCIPYFAFYEKTEIEKYLENMAAKGWMLEKIKPFYWQFHKIEPSAIHFTITYYPNPDVSSDELSEDQQMFFEFCEHDGWKVVTATQHMNVFYNRQKDPFPIESDAVLEVENIQKVLKKELSSNLSSVVLWITYVMLNFFKASLEDLANNFIWLTTLFALLFGCIYIVRSIRLNNWCKKAQAAAELDGTFLEMPKYRWNLFPFLYHISLPLIFVLYIIGKLDGGFYLNSILVAMLLIFFLFFWFFCSWLKKKQFDEEKNTSYVLYTFLFAPLLLLIVFYPLLNNIPENISPTHRTEVYYYEGEQEYQYLDELPLTLEDLLGNQEELNSELFSCKLDFSKSFLLEYCEAEQYAVYPLLGTGLPSLEYTVVKMKLPFLQSYFWHMFLDEYDWDGGDITYSVQETDDDSWNADFIYQQYCDEKSTGTYIIECDNYIFSIDADWDLTDEQKALITATLTNL